MSDERKSMSRLQITAIVDVILEEFLPGRFARRSSDFEFPIILAKYELRKGLFGSRSKLVEVLQIHHDDGDLSMTLVGDLPEHEIEELRHLFSTKLHQVAEGYPELRPPILTVSR